MKHDAEAGGHRHARLEVSVREELQSIIRDDVSDPELEGVVVSAVVLSPDYRNARVHFLVPRGRPRSAVERAFAVRHRSSVRDSRRRWS